MVIVADVDGCVLGSGCQVRPGVPLMLAWLGWRGDVVHLWSAAGRARACEAGRLLGVPVVRCHAKPPMRPVAFRAALHRLGAAPDVTVDNDHAHRVEGVPLVLVESWWG